MTKYSPPTLGKRDWFAPPLTANFAPPPPDDERDPGDGPWSQGAGGRPVVKVSATMGNSTR